MYVLTTFVMHLIAYRTIMDAKTRIDFPLYGFLYPQVMKLPRDENIRKAWNVLQMKISGRHGMCYGLKYPEGMKCATDENIRKAWNVLRVKISRRHGMCYGLKYPEGMESAMDENIRKS